MEDLLLIFNRNLKKKTDSVSGNYVVFFSEKLKLAALS